MSLGSPSPDYTINYTELTLYLVFTLASVITSIVFYIYVMSFTDINKHDRE